jgi:hypothetical protein
MQFKRPKSAIKNTITIHENSYPKNIDKPLKNE